MIGVDVGEEMKCNDLGEHLARNHWMDGACWGMLGKRISNVPPPKIGSA
jgi:hypothetical protein